jgi:multisubunit Na+/H+ antiporter MnhC subunit
MIFHPLVIPTMGFILFFYSGFYFSLLSWEARRLVLLVVFFSTALLPLLAVAVMALNSRQEQQVESPVRRILPLLFSSFFYYLGYLLLHRMDAYPVFQAFLLASIFIQFILMLLSFKWRISWHMAAWGGLTGAFLALSFRTGTNPVWAIILAVLASGITGWSRLALEKNKLWQLEAGYAVGLVVLYLFIYFL